MTDRTVLEGLSSKELHDRAVHLAERRMDVAFLWRLIKAIPPAQAGLGNLEQAEADLGVGDLVPMLHDWEHAGEGELGDALRPLYLEYVEKHERSG